MKIDWGMVMIWMLVIVPALAVFGIFFRLDRKEKQRGTRFLGIEAPTSKLQRASIHKVLCYSNRSLTPQSRLGGTGNALVPGFNRTLPF